MQAISDLLGQLVASSTKLSNLLQDAHKSQLVPDLWNFVNKSSANASWYVSALDVKLCPYWMSNCFRIGCQIVSALDVKLCPHWMSNCVRIGCQIVSALDVELCPHWMSILLDQLKYFTQLHTIYNTVRKICSKYMAIVPSAVFFRRTKHLYTLYPAILLYNLLYGSYYTSKVFNLLINLPFCIPTCFLVCVDCNTFHFFSAASFFPSDPPGWFLKKSFLENLRLAISSHSIALTIISYSRRRKKKNKQALRAWNNGRLGSIQDFSFGGKVSSSGRTSGECQEYSWGVRIFWKWICAEVQPGALKYLWFWDATVSDLNDHNFFGGEAGQYTQ